MRWRCWNADVGGICPNRYLPRVQVRPDRASRKMPRHAISALPSVEPSSPGGVLSDRSLGKDAFNRLTKESLRSQENDHEGKRELSCFFSPSRRTVKGEANSTWSLRIRRGIHVFGSQNDRDAATAEKPAGGCSARIQAKALATRGDPSLSARTSTWPAN
jgi:hypothetical protein